MKHSLLICFLFSALRTVAQEESAAQDTVARNYEFMLKDGTRITGQLINQDNQSYTIKTANFGTIRIANNQLVSLSLLDAKTNQSISPNYFENQFAHKYFFFSTAVPVEQKKWVYTSQYLFFSDISYGINKRVSVGAAFFTFVPTSLISPHLKITLNPESKTKFAVSAQYVFVRGNGSNTGGFFRATMTRGTTQNNFTFGYAKFFSNRGVDETSIVTLGFVKKVSPKLSVISENNIIVSDRSTSNSFGLLSGGLRFDRRTHAFDLGLLVPTSGLDSNLNLIPYLGFNLKLN